MLKNKWSIKVNEMAHKPFTILDEKEQVVCVVYGHLDQEEHAKAIVCAKEYRDCVESIVEYFGKPTTAINADSIELLKKISKIELKYYTPIIKH
jgi:hypothetical protein